MTHKTKLLFVSNLFPDKAEPFRGLDNATLLHHLSDDYEIRVLSPRPDLSIVPWGRVSRDVDHHFFPAYIRTRYLPKIGSRVNHRLMARALRPALEKLRHTFAFDIVLCSWVYPDGCAVAELAREMHFPFAVIAQGSDVHQYLQMPVRREIIVASMRGAGALITRSAELARMLAEAGVDGGKVHPVYNGVDFSVFHAADRTQARRELGLPPDARIVLFVGNFFEIKNPMLLVEAVAELHRDRAMEKVMFVAIGGGPLEKKVRKLAVKLGLGSNARFAGRMPASQVARHMQASDVLCLPSRHEGVPNVILEAFACGLPVVASRVGGIPEVLRHDFLGGMVESGNLESLVAELKKQLETPPETDLIAAYARTFSWTATAAEYEAILERARTRA